MVENLNYKQPIPAIQRANSINIGAGITTTPQNTRNQSIKRYTSTPNKNIETAIKHSAKKYKEQTDKHSSTECAKYFMISFENKHMKKNDILEFDKNTWFINKQNPQASNIILSELMHDISQNFDQVTVQIFTQKLVDRIRQLDTKIFEDNMDIQYGDICKASLQQILTQYKSNSINLKPTKNFVQVSYIPVEEQTQSLSQSVQLKYDIQYLISANHNDYQMIHPQTKKKTTKEKTTINLTEQNVDFNIIINNQTGIQQSLQLQSQDLNVLDEFSLSFDEVFMYTDPEKFKEETMQEIFLILDYSDTTNPKLQDEGQVELGFKFSLDNKMRKYYIQNLIHYIDQKKKNLQASVKESLDQINLIIQPFKDDVQFDQKKGIEPRKTANGHNKTGACYMDQCSIF